MAHWPSWISVPPMIRDLSLSTLISLLPPFFFGPTCHISGEVQEGDWVFCVRERLLGKVGDEERNLVPAVSQEIFSQLQGLRFLVSIPTKTSLGPPAPETAWVYFSISAPPSSLNTVFQNMFHSLWLFIAFLEAIN